MALTYESHQGFPDGMNVALAAFEISDTHARYMQDMLVDQPGLTRMRGGVTAVAGFPALTRKGSGMAVTLTPQGVEHYALLNGDNSNGYCSFPSDNLSTLTDIAWPHSLPCTPLSAQPYTFVDTKAAYKGGALLGSSSAFTAASPNQALAYWRGANKATYANTVTISARGISIVTGTGFTANVCPGMFLFANTDDGATATLIGCVKSVQSNTSLTLLSPSPYAVTGLSGSFQSLRGVYPRVTVGRITCATTDTAVNGGATKFRSQGMATGTWNVYRASDSTWIGKVSSVTNDIQLVLTASAAVACVDEAYFAIRADGNWALDNHTLGFLTSVYANRQWYANCLTSEDTTSRVWFSDTSGAEDVNTTEFDGDWLYIPSSSSLNEPIRAIASSTNALCVFKENEVWGIFGSTPSSFTVQRIHDDGVLDPMAVQPYGNGVIWAGRRGVYYYDGTNVNDITTQKFGEVWRNSVKTFDPSTYRMYSAVIRNHYFCYIEALTPTIGITKGATTQTPTAWTLCVNMATAACTLLTNVNIRGTMALPTSTTKQVYYLVNNATNGVVCDGAALFDSEGVLDTVTCDSGTAGPDGYIETKKYNAGDSMRLKHFRYFAANYLAQSGTLTVDTVAGLNALGSSLTNMWVDTTYSWATFSAAYPSWASTAAAISTWQQIILGNYSPAQQYYGLWSQHISFRIYRTTSAVNYFRLGPLSLGYKYGREGRVT